MSVRVQLGVVLVGLAFAAGALAKEWPGKVPTPAERGKELYDRHCLACHGPLGKGDGPAAAALVVKPPDLSNGFGARSDDQLVEIVLRGRGGMPGFDQAFRDLKPLEGGMAVYARNVLDHMKQLGKEGAATPEKPAKVAPEKPAQDEEAGGDAP